MPIEQLSPGVWNSCAAKGSEEESFLRNRGRCSVLLYSSDISIQREEIIPTIEEIKKEREES